MQQTSNGAVLPFLKRFRRSRRKEVWSAFLYESAHAFDFPWMPATPERVVSAVWGCADMSMEDNPDETQVKRLRDLISALEADRAGALELAAECLQFALEASR